MRNDSARRVTLVLTCLVLFDICLAIIGYFFRDFWFFLFHGTDYVDPQGYLPRAAGNWTMFALLQLVALVNWKTNPVWLAMVAAVRFSDALTDWSCLHFCESATFAGKTGFLAAGILNLVLGFFFIRAWKKSER